MTARKVSCAEPSEMCGAEYRGVIDTNDRAKALGVCVETHTHTHTHTHILNKHKMRTDQSYGNQRTQTNNKMLKCFGAKICGAGSAQRVESVERKRVSDLRSTRRTNRSNIFKSRMCFTTGVGLIDFLYSFLISRER